MTAFLNRLLLAVLLAALAGCANGMALRTSATATDETPDRILVTLPVNELSDVADLSPSGRLDYFPESAMEQRDAQRDRARAIATEFEMQIEEDWPIPALGVYCFVFRLDEPAQRERIITALAAHPDVESVQPLNFFHAEGAPGNTARTDPLADVQQALASGLADVHELATGKHVGIAVIDTGADLRHEDLADASITALDLVGTQTETGIVPAEHHGTAIIGVIAADSQNGKGISGYAPDAAVFLLRACWETPEQDERAACNTFTLAKALSHALAARVDIVNLSITGPRDPLLEQLAAVMVERGTLLVAAGPGESFPASVPGSFVASQLLADADRAVMTLLPGDRYGVRGGTSLGAARISGIAALLRQIAPDLPVAELQRRIGLLRNRPVRAAFGGFLPPQEQSGVSASSLPSSAR